MIKIMNSNQHILMFAILDISSVSFKIVSERGRKNLKESHFLTLIGTRAGARRGGYV